ncbi:TolC family protein [Desulfatitalea tepidiphila]|uniref:TolC family protein n=1 Tax=Desulfatitalea tepidiphila TaxID=1185843 RepID=UPI0006B40D9D|nr:TolC family protein [Desulfatitalea tepidiphila]
MRLFRCFSGCNRAVARVMRIVGSTFSLRLSGPANALIPLALAAGIVCHAAVPPAGAESSLPTLTLEDAIATAVKFNPYVQASRHEVTAADAQVTQARSGLLPQLEVSETYNRTTSPLWAFGTRLNQGAITARDFDPDRLNDPDPIDNFRTALTLSWNIFDGGQTWIGWRQARENLEAGNLALQRTEQEIIAQTAITYVGCLLAAEERGVVDQALETAGAHLKVVEDRERSGLAVKSDVLRARVRIGELSQQRLQADSQVNVALAQLGAVMGTPDAVPPGTRLAGAFSQCTAPQGELDAWIETALNRRSDLKQLDLQETVARRQLDRARAAHLPTLALQGNYEINSEDFSDSHDSYAVGAVLQMNLFSGQRISARAAEAKAMAARVRAMRDAQALNVRVDTQRAYYQAQSAWQSIEVARTAVDQAEEGLRITANRYRNGLLALVSLLDAQVALQQAQTRHFKALHDYKVARIALALASGTLDKDFK